MIEALGLMLMAALTGAAFAFQERERRAWQRERASLLDRIQAPDFHAFKARETPSVVRQPTYLSDADEAKLAMKAS